MSGTSLDGIDAVAVEASGEGFAYLGCASEPFDEVFRGELLSLCSPGSNEIERMQDAANELSRRYAHCVRTLLAELGIAASEVRALGAHGQTVRHRPEAGCTLQIINGALLAELTGIDTVTDFRSRDVAAGGEGAPLVPPFHARWFDEGKPFCVVNIGGMSNITAAGGSRSPFGFDCGPGNVLLDAWAGKHLGVPYDEDGRWAASGKTDEALLERFLSEPFFAKAPPKSTGRELFSADWIARHLSGGEKPEDVQATLLELTARAVSQSVLAWAPQARSVYLCGGGVRNKALFARIQALLPECAVMSTAEKGLPPESVEGAAFAWLAWAFAERVSANEPRVTGASGYRILGCLYPA
jgi:anhydro-N-acetylmuramic acid kinase